MSKELTDNMGLSENINNILNRMSTLKVDFLSPSLYKSQYEQYYEMVDESIETLNLIKDMDDYFKDRVLTYPIIVATDLTNQELLISGTITRNVIYINVDINFLYKFDNKSILPGTHYFANYFNSLSYTDKFKMLINSLNLVKTRITEIIDMYSDDDE
jgi:hypothetical protein